MNENKLRIHLIDGTIIESKEHIIFFDNIFNRMNNNDDNIIFNCYIIPKSRINYIELVLNKGEEDETN